jgi:hypothetical protein
MKSISMRVAVLNSLLFIRDRSIEDIPQVDGNGAAWSTSSCIAVSCLPDCDGDTEIMIGPAKDVARTGIPLLDSQLHTPSRTVIVESVTRQVLLVMHVPHADTRVRIWTNGHRATDTVVIGLD